MALESLKKRAEALRTNQPVGQEAEYEMERQNYPLADEVGLIHPLNKSSILLRDSGAIDLFMVPDMGMRMDPDVRSQTHFVPRMQYFGNEWSALIQELFAVEVKEDAYFKTRRMFAKFRETLKTKVRDLWEALVRDKIAIYGRYFWGILTKQFYVKAGKRIILEAPEIQIRTPISKIGVQGHYLDDKVLYTEEMYKDILKIEKHLESLQVWLQGHTHTGNLGAPTSQPLSSPPSAPDLNDYTDPVTKPWPDPGEPVPEEVQDDIGRFQNETWDYLTEGNWEGDDSGS
jgi:hypothetical protein